VVNAKAVFDKHVGLALPHQRDGVGGVVNVDQLGFRGAGLRHGFAGGAAANDELLAGTDIFKPLDAAALLDQQLDASAQVGEREVDRAGALGRRGNVANDDVD